MSDALAELKARNAALEASIAKLVEEKRLAREVNAAAEAFLRRVDAVCEHERYMQVWATAQFHDGPYDGPQYAEEAEALRWQLVAFKKAVAP